MMRRVIWYAATRRTAAPSAACPAALAAVLLALLGCVVGPADPAIAGGGPAGGDRGQLVGAAAAAPVPVAAEATVPDPALPGPWQVGYRTVRIADPHRPGRVLVTSLWYPARPNASTVPGSPLPGPTGTNAGPRPGAGSGAGGACPEAAAGGPGSGAGPGRRAFYPLIGDIGFDSASAVTDAVPAPGPFALVVFSHGSAGSRVQAAYLMEALASHGFLVAAPDHPGDTMTDAAAGRVERQLALATDRPRDVSAVIDALTDPSCPAASRVRLDEIAVVGFSFGGFTAVVSSIGVLSAPADPRIRATVGIAPATSPLPAAALARVRVPTLLIGGTRDLALSIPANVDRAFALLVGSHPRMTVAVTGAVHNSFTEICRQVRLLGAAGIPVALGLRVALTSAATCWPPQIAPADAHRLADRYTVAFLARHLRGESGYARYLTPPDAGDARLVTVRAQP
ncbi:serine aminopeptidase domain-containing protein [Frankia sp. QA3]|uniref:alpha/beta hydrolase family protein n=1 Tax=Frankia sp. QA3 TaxID=710111 RepID=UPI000269BAB8|nr:alpha/beta hydrolase [Frankia sp. QA3]EIV90992.1 isoform II [Frankia sp. QA3]